MNWWPLNFYMGITYTGYTLTGTSTGCVPFYSYWGGTLNTMEVNLVATGVPYFGICTINTDGTPGSDLVTGTVSSPVNGWNTLLSDAGIALGTRQYYYLKLWNSDPSTGAVSLRAAGGVGAREVATIPTVMYFRWDGSVMNTVGRAAWAIHYQIGSDWYGSIITTDGTYVSNKKVGESHKYPYPVRVIGAWFQSTSSIGIPCRLSLWTLQQNSWLPDQQLTYVDFNATVGYNYQAGFFTQPYELAEFAVVLEHLDGTNARFAANRDTYTGSSMRMARIYPHRRGVVWNGTAWSEYMNSGTWTVNWGALFTPLYLSGGAGGIKTVSLMQRV